MFHEILAHSIKVLRQQMVNNSNLPREEQLQQYYAIFRERFGAERLRSMDGETLLEFMHGRGHNTTALCTSL